MMALAAKISQLDECGVGVSGVGSTSISLSVEAITGFCKGLSNAACHMM